MKFGEIVRSRVNYSSGVAFALILVLIPQGVFAQNVAPVAAPSATLPAATYTPLGPDMIKGQPEAGPEGFWFQPQHSPFGKDAIWMHDAVLMPVITVISLLVLALLLYIVARYNKRANPVASRTSHNTTLEVLWTGIPILILVAIFIPSLNLLVDQFHTPPKTALTVKATGYQWYWGYTYPDNGGFEVISNMLPDDQAVAKGFPPQLEADHRMVVPVGVPIRMQTTGSDVIHSFAVPSLWFKLDAVPGRINEKWLEVDEPGIYYGQCSELCGARHGYMPIEVEAVPMEQFKAWVLSQGGTVGGTAPAAAPAIPAPAAVAPAVAAPAKPAPSAA